MEIEKQQFGKQMFAAPCLTMGHREGFDQTDPARFLSLCDTVDIIKP